MRIARFSLNSFLQMADEPSKLGTSYNHAQLAYLRNVVRAVCRNFMMLCNPMIQLEGKDGGRGEGGKRRQ